MKEFLPSLASKLIGIRGYLIAAGVAVVLITGVWYAGKWQGSQEQKVTQANEKAKATMKGVQSHDKVNRDVQKMSDPDLDASLVKWMRD